MSALLLSGIISFSVLLISWWAYKKLVGKKFHFSLAAILLLGLILRLYADRSPELHRWDERYHALVSKNLINDPSKPFLYANPVLPYDKLDWVSNQAWLSKPPVPLWGIAASVKMFGPNVYAVRLPSLIYGLLAIWLTFLIGKLLFHEKVGLFAAFLFAIHGVLIELGAGRISSDHVEVAHLFYVELALFLTIWFVQKKPVYWVSILIGVATALAFLCKWYPALIVFPLWFLILVYWKKYPFKFWFVHGCIVLVGFLAISLPWVAYILHEFPVEARHILTGTISAYDKTVQNHDAPFFYYWHKLLVLYGELIFVVIALAIYHACYKLNSRKLVVLLSWALIPVLVFSFAQTKRFTYILIAAPAFFVLAGYCWFYLKEEWKLRKYKFIKPLILVALIALPLRFMVERTKLFQKEETISQFYEKLPGYQQRFDKNDIVFGLEEHIELMFFTNVYAAYREIPPDEKIEELKAQGFDVYTFLE